MAVTLPEIVIAEGLIQPSALAQAAEDSDRERLPIVVALVRDHGLDEVAVVAALKKHLRIKTLDPAKVEFDSDALRELHRNDCRRLRAVPISLQLFGAGPQVLGVAMADPTDTVAIAELEHLSGCSVEPVLVTLSAVEEMIESAYKHSVTEVMPRASLQRKAGAHLRKKSRTWSMEANAQLRVEALRNLCIAKGVFSEEEFERALADLLKKDQENSSGD
jgi:hypothetical protein